MLHLFLPLAQLQDKATVLTTERKKVSPPGAGEPGESWPVEAAAALGGRAIAASSTH